MDSKKAFFTAIILIALGISFNTSLRDSMGGIGTVFIALGGFFFIVAMSRRKKEADNKDNDST